MINENSTKSTADHERALISILLLNYFHTKTIPSGFEGNVEQNFKQ